MKVHAQSPIFKTRISPVRLTAELMRSLEPSLVAAAIIGRSADITSNARLFVSRPIQPVTVGGRDRDAQ